MAACVIKQVLRGTTTMSGGSPTTVNIGATVDTAKTFYSFSIKNERASVYDYAVRLTVTSTTQITFTREGANAETVTISWEAVEFTSASGISVQHGTEVFSSSGTKNITISTINLSKSWAMISLSRPNTTLSQNSFVRARLTSTTNLELDSYSSSSFTVDWQVVQYDDCTVQVQDIGGVNATSGTNDLASTVNTAKTAIFSSAKGATSGTYNNTQIYRLSISSTYLQFDKYGDTSLGFDICAFIVSFTDNTMVDHYSKALASGTTSTTQTITSRDPSLSFINSSNALGRLLSPADTAVNNEGEAMIEMVYTNSTTITISRTNSASNATQGFQIIAFLASSAASSECRAVGRGIMCGVGRGIC